MISVISEVIIILSLLAIGPDLGDDLAVGGLKRRADTIQVNLNLRLLKSSRVAVELDAIDISRQLGGCEVSFVPGGRVGREKRLI